MNENAMRYRAGIEQTEATIKRFTKTVYNTYNSNTKAIEMAFSLLLILIGINTNIKFFSALVTFLGCIAFASINFLPKSQAKQIIQNAKGKLPSSEFEFYDDLLIDTKDKKKVSYEKIERLVDDKSYLYLLFGPAGGYMIDYKSIRGEGDAEDFKRMLSSATGLKWSKPTTIFNYSLKKPSLDKLRKGDEGPRLKG